MISAGRMRHPVDILEPVDDKQRQGTAIPRFRIAWRDMAAIEPIGGREYWESRGAQSNITHRVKMRWRPNGIMTRHKIRFDNRVFEVTNVLNMGERDRIVQAMCTEMQ